MILKIVDRRMERTSLDYKKEAPFTIKLLKLIFYVHEKCTLELPILKFYPL